MSELRVHLRAESQEAVLSGAKSCAVMDGPLGRPGDTFLVAGRRYVVTGVRREALRDIASRLWREDGSASPEAFRDGWEGRGEGRWDPGRRLWVTFFRRAEADVGRV